MCEHDLAPLPRPTKKFQIQHSLFADSVIARASISDFTAELDEPAGENIYTMLKAKCVLLRTMDKTAIIEIAFFGSMSGEVGHTRFKDSDIRCLPSAAQPFEWARSCAMLDQCLSSAFAKFCGRGLISQGQTILSWLRSGEAGRPPQCEAVTSDFLKQARSCLAFFTRAEDAKK